MILFHLELHKLANVLQVVKLLAIRNEIVQLIMVRDLTYMYIRSLIMLKEQTMSLTTNYK